MKEKGIVLINVQSLGSFIHISIAGEDLYTWTYISIQSLLQPYCVNGFSCDEQFGGRDGSRIEQTNFKSKEL